MLGWPGRQAATFPVMPAAEVMQDTRPVTRSDLPGICAGWASGRAAC